MTNGPEHHNRLVTASEFFSRAQERLTFDVPAALTNPDAIERPDAYNADPALLAAIAAVRPIRPAAVLVPVIQHNKPSVLFTKRTARLADHGWEISFPGGKIDAGDASPAAAALREADEEIGLARECVEPIGYLDVHLTPFGHRIMPVLARVQPGFALRLNPGEDLYPVLDHFSRFHGSDCIPRELVERLRRGHDRSDFGVVLLGSCGEFGDESARPRSRPRIRDG
jgi:8-oxo-dGTP pyrophosphatase MutT (NUDIX family)